MRTQAMRRLRGTLGMGVAWAIGWAIGGLLIGVTSLLIPGAFDGFFSLFDAPLPALALPGFIGGVVFSMVLGVAARDRSFEDLSLPRFAAWGALGGFLLSLVPLIAFEGWHADGFAAHALRTWLTIAIPLTVFGTLSASGTLLLARKGETASLPPGNG